MEKRKRVVKVKKTMRRPKKKKVNKDNNINLMDNNLFEDEKVLSNIAVDEGTKENIDIKDDVLFEDVDVKTEDFSNTKENQFDDVKQSKKDVVLNNKNSKTKKNNKKASKKKYILGGIGAFVLICVVAIIVSYNVLLGAVDSSNTNKMDVTIEEGSSLSGISQTLKEKDLIRSELAFKVYVKLTGKSNDLKAGYYSFSQSQSAGDIVSIMMEGSNSDTATVTIKEGLDLNRIGDTLEEQGIFTKEEFLSEIKNNADYYREKYDFLSSVPKDREYILEGYLFADTYNIYVNSTPRDLIEKMLDRFDQEYTDEYKKRTKEMGKTIDEIVTMASVVERETILDSELPTVAGVFYNRLEKGMMLQSCATLQYIYKDYQFSFTESQKNIDSPYNTYKYEGLPAGPISNFRAASLKAALYPEDTDYLYFCTKNDGTGASAFAKTYEEHEANIQKYSGNWE